MIYNNWWNTLNMNLSMVERLAQLPTVVALKWSAPSSGQFTEGLHRMANRLAVIDNENQIVWSHMMGAVGFITHVSNFWPAYPGELADLLQQRRYDEVIARLAFFQWPWSQWVDKAVAETEGEGPFIKVAMEEVGLRVGPPRPPARPLSAALRQELHELFVRVGVPRMRD